MIDKDIKHLSEQISTLYEALIEMRKDIDVLQKFQSVFLTQLCDKHQKEFEEEKQ